jgi:hypothetical protein
MKGTNQFLVFGAVGVIIGISLGYLTGYPIVGVTCGAAIGAAIGSIRDWLGLPSESD